jgi:hypothetical protein
MRQGSTRKSFCRIQTLFTYKAEFVSGKRLQQRARPGAQKNNLLEVDDGLSTGFYMIGAHAGDMFI